MQWNHGEIRIQDTNKRARMTSRTLALAPPGHPVLPLLLGAVVLTSKGSNTAAIIRHGSVSSSGYCYVSTLD